LPSGRRAFKKQKLVSLIENLTACAICPWTLKEVERILPNLLKYCFFAKTAKCIPPADSLLTS
jgi:hypothetical protein